MRDDFHTQSDDAVMQIQVLTEDLLKVEPGQLAIRGGSIADLISAKWASEQPIVG